MAMEGAEIVGTPLISDRERRKLVSDPKSFSKNTWDQTVTDKEGRRRFHGAFTGGFSAGYFNTVGSKEGWKPQSFSSSRTNRADRVQQRPEDFMDEEDDPMLGRSLNEKLAYDTLGRKSRELARQAVERESGSGSGSGGIIPGSLPDELVVAKSNSVGMRLMKSMGWREGQGVGPLQKVGLSGRRVHEDGRVTVDPHAAGLRFAPRNTRVRVPDAKVDSHGVGYVNTANFTLKSSGAEGLKKQSYIRMQGGIGTSVLEDNDDIDVYEQDDPSAYAFGTRRLVEAPRRLLRDTPSEQLVPVHGPFPGFCLAQDSERVIPYTFAEVEVPKDFVPRHVFPKDCTAPRESLGTMTPHQRGFVLGEKEVKSESVFNLLSAESQAKLKKAIGERKKSMATPASRAAEGALASRFVPEQTRKQTEVLKPGIRATNHSALEVSKEAAKVVQKREPQRLQLNRVTIPWNPDRILCKRFNVPVPEVKQMPVPSETFSTGVFREMLNERVKPEREQEPVELLQVNTANMSLFKEIFEKTGNDEASSFEFSSSEEDAEDLQGGAKAKEKSSSRQRTQAPYKRSSSEDRLEADTQKEEAKDAFHTSVRFLSRAEREKARGPSSTKRKKKLVSHRELFNDGEKEQKTTIVQEHSEHAEESLPDWVRSAMGNDPSSSDARDKHHKSKSKKKKSHKKSLKKHHKKKKKKDRS